MTHHIWSNRYRYLAIALLTVSAIAIVYIRDEFIAEHVTLKLEIVIPSDVPESINSFNKSKEPIAWNPRAEYPYHFSIGWEWCLSSFLRDQYPGINPSVDDVLHDP